MDSGNLYMYALQCEEGIDGVLIKVGLCEGRVYRISYVHKEDLCIRLRYHCIVYKQINK